MQQLLVVLLEYFTFSPYSTVPTYDVLVRTVYLGYDVELFISDNACYLHNLVFSYI